MRSRYNSRSAGAVIVPAASKRACSAAPAKAMSVTLSMPCEGSTSLPPLRTRSFISPSTADANYRESLGHHSTSFAVLSRPCQPIDFAEEWIGVPARVVGHRMTRFTSIGRGQKQRGKNLNGRRAGGDGTSCFHVVGNRLDVKSYPIVCGAGGKDVVPSCTALQDWRGRRPCVSGTLRLAKRSAA